MRWVQLPTLNCFWDSIIMCKVLVTLSQMAWMVTVIYVSSVQTLLNRNCLANLLSVLFSGHFKMSSLYMYIALIWCSYMKAAWQYNTVTSVYRCINHPTNELCCHPPSRRNRVSASAGTVRELITLASMKELNEVHEKYKAGHLQGRLTE